MPERSPPITKSTIPLPPPITKLNNVRIPLDLLLLLTNLLLIKLQLIMELTLFNEIAPPPIGAVLPAKIESDRMPPLFHQ